MHPQTATRIGTAEELDSALSCQLSLNRALVPFREPRGSLPGGRLQDIGLGVVVDDSDLGRAEVLDLGSAEVRVTDLAGPLVVLGRLYPSGLRSLEAVLDGPGADAGDRARSFTFAMALRILRDAGFGPLTRPTVLRIGFRDLCQDLDFHEGTAVRVVSPSRAIARIHLDYETATLIVRTGRSEPDRGLELVLSESFSTREVLRSSLRDPIAPLAYHLLLPIPRTLSEARALLSLLLSGLTRLLAQFEPERSRSLREYSGALGTRDSLRTLRDAGELDLERIGSGWSEGRSGSRDVH